MEQNNADIFENGLDQTARTYLLETTRWTKFLAIIGFLTSLCFFLFGILYLYANGNFGTSYGMGVSIGQLIYFLLMASLYIYPAYALLKFSSLMKSGIHTNDQDRINNALRFQKNLYRYMGIMTIIGLVLILLLFLFAGMNTSGVYRGI